MYDVACFESKEYFEHTFKDVDHKSELDSPLAMFEKKVWDEGDDDEFNGGHNKCNRINKHV